jgi:hypothetical protein
MLLHFIWGQSIIWFKDVSKENSQCNFNHISHTTFNRNALIFCVKIQRTVTFSVASQSTTGPYPSSDRRLSAKLLPTFAGRVCHVISAANPHGRNFNFSDRSRYYFFKVAPQFSSRGWVDSVPDPLLLRKSGIAGNRTWETCICS